MTAFFDRLRADERLQEALRLADGVSDETLQSRLKMVLSLRLAGAELSDAQLHALIEPTSRGQVTALPGEQRPRSRDLGASDAQSSPRSPTA
jgi:hypothetical protein